MVQTQGILAVIKWLYQSHGTTMIVRKNSTLEEFPGGDVDKNLCTNAGDTGLIPGPGRVHLP